MRHRSEHFDGSDDPEGTIKNRRVEIVIGKECNREV
jgi:flagellar motor protein MotB